jgi:hypothetical protein
MSHHYIPFSLWGRIFQTCWVAGDVTKLILKGILYEEIVFQLSVEGQYRLSKITLGKHERIVHTKGIGRLGSRILFSNW